MGGWRTRSGLVIPRAATPDRLAPPGGRGGADNSGGGRRGADAFRSRVSAGWSGFAIGEGGAPRLELGGCFFVPTGGGAELDAGRQWPADLSFQEIVPDSTSPSPGGRTPWSRGPTPVVPRAYPQGPGGLPAACRMPPWAGRQWPMPVQRPDASFLRRPARLFPSQPWTRTACHRTKPSAGPGAVVRRPVGRKAGRAPLSRSIQRALAHA